MRLEPLRATVGEVGAVLTFELGLDLTALTTRQIQAEKPDGTTVTLTAALVGPATRGVISYTTAAGVLDQAGVWTLRPVVSVGAGNVRYGLAESLIVEALLPDAG